MTQITQHPFLNSPDFMGRIVSECLSWDKQKADALLPKAPEDAAKPWSLSFRVARYAATMATTMERSATREAEYQDERDKANTEKVEAPSGPPEGSGY